MRERLNRAVSKTVEPSRVPWVRIPPSPPDNRLYLQSLTGMVPMSLGNVLSTPTQRRVSQWLSVDGNHNCAPPFA